MHLVPCRWEKSGWKYVESDPAKHGFFNNQNRINSHGFSPNQKSQINAHYYQQQGMVGPKFETVDQFATTYKSFFDP